MDCRLAVPTLIGAKLDLSTVGGTMSTKAQTVSIQLPSGRIVHTDVPTKAKSAPVADMSL